MLNPRRYSMRKDMITGEWKMVRDSVEGAYVPYLDHKTIVEELEKQRNKYKNLYLDLSQFVTPETMADFYRKHKT